MIELRHWRAYMVTAEEGNISAAADRLSVSQPALSKQISELERELGVQLFERQARGVVLTASGRYLLTYSKRVCAAVDEAERESADLRGLRKGRILVAASTSIADYLLPTGIALFAARYPGISVVLRVGNTREIARMVSEDECELGLVEGPAHYMELDARPFYEDELVVIAPPGHPLLAKSQVSASDVLSYGFVMREQGSGTRGVFENSVSSKGFSIVQVAELGSTEAVKRAVHLGLGLGVASRLTIGDELREGRLVEVKLSDMTLRRPLSRLIRNGRGTGRVYRAFMSALEDSLLTEASFAGFALPHGVESNWDPVI